MAIDKVQQGKDNLEWGKEAEEIALQLLFSKGYAVRDRNWRAGKTIEVDIIAQKGFDIIFVEVKARKGDHQLPLEAINTQKRRKMIKAADIYMQQFPMPFQYRFDIILITGTRESYEIEHIEDAFLPGVNGSIGRY